MNDSDVIDALNDLIETCRDGEYGFRASAEQAKAQPLKTTLMARATECQHAAEQLAQQVLSLGGKAEDGGSTAGALHRGWVAVKTKLTSYDDLAVLEECERGEDNALKRYRDVLDRGLPQQVRSLVESQYEGVKRNHNQIRSLRDDLRASERAEKASR